MRDKRQPMASSSSSRATAKQLLLFLAVGYHLRLPGSYGFVQRVSYRRSPPSLPIPSSLGAVQVDPQQQQRQSAGEEKFVKVLDDDINDDSKEASARRLDKLLEKTPRDDQVLKEIAGHIEILCCSDDDDEDSDKSNQERSSSTTGNSAGGARNEESTASSDNDNKNGEKDGEEVAAKERRKLAARAALLGSRSPPKRINKPPSSSTRASSRTTTSVGTKRVGSASRARQGPGVTKRIMDAVRKSASSNSNNNSNNKPKDGYAKDDENNSPSTPSNSLGSAAATPKKNRTLNPSKIHSAVFELLERQKKDSSVAPPPPEISTVTQWNRDTPQLLQPPSPATSGDVVATESSSLFACTPPPGTVLIPPVPSADVSSSTTATATKLQFPECLTIRVAHGLQTQDTELAHLRLSVFSDFSPEVRRQLVPRSVNAVVSRRMKGATCLLATIPPSVAARRKNRPPIILGSAECSYHEFEGTTLGRRRPAESILYITEVAVSPNARRRGIGRKLLEAIDLLAEMRKVETLYLHVDVDNESALTLYEQAGFSKVEKLEPMFMEFTTKLNLHDGATKGRNHFLLYKDMVTCPTWLADHEQVDTSSSATTAVPTVPTLLRPKFHHPPPPPPHNARTLGFQIPQ